MSPSERNSGNERKAVLDSYSMQSRAIEIIRSKHRKRQLPGVNWHGQDSWPIVGRRHRCAPAHPAV